MRDVFCAEMLRSFGEEKFVFLTGDLGFKALEPLQEKLGDYFINVGISEQNMVSVAAGIAKTGLQVFCYSIAPFAFARPFEQIRNDVCLHNLPVTIVGNGGGYGYGVMGATHHAIEDYGALLTLQNMHAFVPAFDSDVGAMINQITKIKRPSYLRLGYAKNCGLISYAPWRKLLNGKKGIAILCGAIASDILIELRNIEETERPTVWVVCELSKNIELPSNLRTELQNQSLCIVEEHVAQSGVGQITASLILQDNIVLKSFSHLHAQGYVSGFYGSQNFHRQESGLTHREIMKFTSK